MKRVEIAAMALFALAALAYFAVLFRNNCGFAAGPDSSGYSNEARLIASGHATREVRLMYTLRLPADLIPVFTPLGFCRAPRPFWMSPLYPAGQPLHQVLFAAIGGWARAPFLVGPVMALLCIVAMVALGRAFGLPLLYALAGGAILGSVPVFVVYALQTASDDVATFWAIVPVAIALRSRRSWFLAAAGLAFAVGVWVRPTNLLLVLPLASAVAWEWRRLLALAAGAVPAGAALGWWQKILYGSPFHNGYGTVAQVLMKRPDCASTHMSALWAMLTPIVFAGAAFVFLLKRVPLRDKTTLALWFVPFLLFYSFYYWCDGWLASRFLLPAVPAVIVAFLFVLRESVSLVGSRSHPVFAGIVALFVIATVVGVMITEQIDRNVYGQKRIDDIYPETVRFAEARLPKNAIVTCGLMSGAFLYYADRETVRWDEVTKPGRAPVFRAAAKKAGLEWYAVESTVEVTPEQFDAWLPAKWIPVAMYRDVTLWKLQE